MLILCLLATLHGSPGASGQAPDSAPAAPGATSGARLVAWGQVVDPLGHSEIKEGGGRIEMSVPAGAYDLSIELGQVTAPRLVRPVEGDHEAQVTVDELPEPALGPPGQPRRPFHGAGLLLWHDERTYVRLEAAVMRASDGATVRYALFEVRREGRVLAGLAATDLRLDHGPADLRLARRGTELVGQVRQGGGDWREAGRASLELPSRASVGIAAVNRAASPLRARFSRFELSTAPGSLAPLAGGEPARSTDSLTDFDAPPRIRKSVRPQYPQRAFLERIQGTVLVEALVDAKGRVAKTRVIQSVPGLDEAALEAARKWEFHPAVRGGKPVATIIHMPVAFRIYDKKP